STPHPPSTRRPIRRLVPALAGLRTLAPRARGREWRAGSGGPPGARGLLAAAGLDDVVGRVVRGRDGAELARLVVLERLQQLGLRVHHERAVPGDRLLDRAASEQEHLELGRA